MHQEFYQAPGVIVSAQFSVFFFASAADKMAEHHNKKKAQERKESGSITHAGRLINGQAASGHSEKVIKNDSTIHEKQPV